MADGGEQDVAPRFVRLGLEGYAETEVAGSDVFAAEVDGLFVAVQCRTHVFCRVDLRTLAPTPHDLDLGPQLSAELHGFARLLHGEAPNGRIVGGERPLLEDRAPEQVGRRHGDLHAVLVEGVPETLDD